MVRGWLTVLALVLVALGVAQAASPGTRLAADDLALSRLLLGQERHLQEASLALEEWAAGRLGTPEALARVRQAHAGTRDLQARIGRRAAGTEAFLAGPARQAARARADLVNKGLELLSRGVASRSDLVAFNRLQGGVAAQGLEGWLRARQGVAARLQGPSVPPRVASFYRWQGGLLSRQLQELALARDLRRVLDGLAEGGRPRADGLSRRGQQICDGLALLQAPPALAGAQGAALQEARSLARLAEAVELMVADPSPESGARVSRCSADLRRESLRAQEQTLGALARMLQL